MGTRDQLILAGLAEHHAFIRREIRRYPHGYGWHKSLGQLPADWSDRELPRLRPRDWTQIRHIRFYRVTSPRMRRPRVRSALRRRPTVRRRTAARRAAGIRSGNDPGGDEPEHPYARKGACA